MLYNDGHSRVLWTHLLEDKELMTRMETADRRVSGVAAAYGMNTNIYIMTVFNLQRRK